MLWEWKRQPTKTLMILDIAAEIYIWKFWINVEGVPRNFYTLREMKYDASSRVNCFPLFLTKRDWTRIEPRCILVSCKYATATDEKSQRLKSKMSSLHKLKCVDKLIRLWKVGSAMVTCCWIQLTSTNSWVCNIDEFTSVYWGICQSLLHTRLASSLFLEISR